MRPALAAVEKASAHTGWVRVARSGEDPVAVDTRPIGALARAELDLLHGAALLGLHRDDKDVSEGGPLVEPAVQVPQRMAEAMNDDQRAAFLKQFESWERLAERTRHSGSRGVQTRVMVSGWPDVSPEPEKESQMLTQESSARTVNGVRGGTTVPPCRFRGFKPVFFTHRSAPVLAGPHLSHLRRHIMAHQHPATLGDFARVALALTIIGLLLAAPAMSGEPHIEAVQLSREPAVCSANSWTMDTLDRLCDTKLQHVYAEVTLQNDADSAFAGSLGWEGNSDQTVVLDPHESRAYLLRVFTGTEIGTFTRSLCLMRRTGPFDWNLETIDTVPLTVEVRDVGFPTCPGPTPDDLGQTVVLESAVERDAVTLVDLFFSTFNFCCLLISGSECFPGLPLPKLHDATIDALKEVPYIYINASQLHSYRRDLTIGWVVQSEFIPNPDPEQHNGELWVGYDREVILLELPEAVVVESATPAPCRQYVSNGRQTVVWIGNGVDKRILPGRAEQITVSVREPAEYQYTASTSLVLQLGPFADKAELADVHTRAPRYDYGKWQENPTATVWLTVASAMRSYTFSSCIADLGYNPLFTGFPYDLVPEYGATPRIRFDQYLRSDLPPEYKLQLRFTYSGSSNITATIDQSARTADIHVPPDWAGEEKVQFTVTDPQGRRDAAALWVTSPLFATLRQGLVEPASGTKAETYAFSVVYTNPTNAHPKKAVVVINGIPHNMKLRAGSLSIKDGAVFEYLAKLSSSQNSFHFEFENARTRSRYPLEGDTPGPIVASLRDVAVRNLSLSSDEPRAGDIVTARAQVENLGTEVELNVPVVFKVNGSVQGAQQISLPIEGISSVLEFPYPVPISDSTETYELRIEAGPVPGESNTGDNVATRSITVRAEPGAISGWVFDQYNIAVEGAVVKVAGGAAGDYGSTTTDADGYFILDGLKPGAAYPYTLEASSEGVGRATKPGIVVHSQQTTQDQVFNLYPVQMDQITSGYIDTDCDFSPDGSKIVFVRWSNTYILITVNVDGTQPRSYTGIGKPLDEGMRPEWSPNGQYIVFNGSGAGRDFGVYRVSASGDGSDAFALATGNSQVYPTWSPDSQWVAYVNGDNEIYKVPVNSGASVRLTQAGKNHEYLAWSPDGATIAYVSGAHELGFLDVATGTEGLVSLCVPNAADLCWLRDSSGLLFAYGGDIWLYYLADGACIQITYEPSADRSPSVPHGANAPELMCFSSNRGATHYNEEYIFVTAFSAPRLYVTNLAVSPNPFTPNGDGQDDQVNISYTLNRAAQVTLKMHDSQGRYIRTVAGNVPQADGAHVLTWDGSDENGNRVNDEVYSYRLDMQDGTEVARPAHGFVGLHKAVVSVGTDVTWPTWSRQGDAIVYLTPGKQLYLCDAPDCTNKRLINTQPFDAWRAPDWSGSGEQIVFPSWTGGDSNTMNLAIVGRDGSDAHEIDSDTYRPCYPRWSPTSDEIVYEIVAGNALTGEYGNLARYELVKISASGGGRTRLTNDPGEDEWPCWSPDGSKIAWSTNRTGNYEIWIMNADGSGQVQFTRNPWYDIFPEFTPDGARLLFGSNRHNGSLSGSAGLWTQPLDGSDKARHLASVGRGVPSPSGDRIVADGQVIELFLSLTKGAIEGRVVDHETSQPVVDATVYLYQGGLIAQTVTNDEGGYQFWNLEPATYVVKAGAAGYVPSDGLFAETHAWVVSKGHDIALKREPSVRMSELSDGERIGSTISVNTRRDAGEVAYVESQYRPVGGEWQSLETTVYPQPALFDTGKLSLASGQYQLRPVAIDASGNRDSSAQVISIEVDHTPPSAAITAPGSGAVVSGTVSVVAACAAPDLDSVSFQYRRRGEVLWINIGPVDVAAPWSAEWRTDSLLDGEFELRAVAMDDVGNADEEPAAIPVTVLNTTARGDLNCDGVVNFDDIQAFVAALVGQQNYESQYPTCHWLNGDIDGDGRVTFDDIGPFVKCLVNGGCPAVSVLGDLNCDGHVDFDDINPFVTALVDQAAYEARYPDCRWLNGDINGSGTVDFDDISPFVTCLVYSGCP
jgi:Tol biopolymer transport system component